MGTLDLSRICSHISQLNSFLYRNGALRERQLFRANDATSICVDWITPRPNISWAADTWPLHLPFSLKKKNSVDDLDECLDQGKTPHHRCNIWRLPMKRLFFFRVGKIERVIKETAQFSSGPCGSTGPAFIRDTRPKLLHSSCWFRYQPVIGSSWNFGGTQRRRSHEIRDSTVSTDCTVPKRKSKVSKGPRRVVCPPRQW